MNELQSIVEACREARRAGEVAVMATLVKVEGSSYRRPGARMVFPATGAPVGMISGGCLESDLAERARSVSDSGTSCTVVYDMRSPDDIVWGLGLGCNGEVRVLLERIEPGPVPAYIDFLESRVRERSPAVLATVFAADEDVGIDVGDRLLFDGSGAPVGDGTELVARVAPDARDVAERQRSRGVAYALDGGRAEALIEYLAPEVRLLVFGAGGDALPLVRLAAALGWRVTVVDNRPAYARPELFPQADAVRCVGFDRLEEQLPSIDARTAVIVMTHHFLHDLDLIRFVLPSDAPYVGLLGPRKRTENLLAELAAQGVEPTPAQLGRLYGPVGLDIGSESPEEIALSALAEIRAVLGGARAGFLRDRPGPLHTP